MDGFLAVPETKAANKLPIPCATPPTDIKATAAPNVAIPPSYLTPNRFPYGFNAPNEP